MNNTKPMRVPPEFEEFLDDLIEQLGGIKPSRQDVMKWMAKDLRGRLIIKKSRFDWRII